MRAGDSATDNDAAFLVVGDRTPGDELTYPDVDLELKEGPDGVKTFRHKDGSPYPKLERTYHSARHLHVRYADLRPSRRRLSRAGIPRPVSL